MIAGSTKLAQNMKNIGLLHYLKVVLEQCVHYLGMGLVYHGSRDRPLLLTYIFSGMATNLK